MRLRWSSVVAAMLVACGVSLVHGEGWFKKHWNGFVRDAQRNNAWPEPFLPADRASVRQPFEIQVANAWQWQNTLSEFHFDDETGKLNEAGRIKVQNILTTNPITFRTIYVVRSRNADLTAGHVASVYEAAAQFVPPGAVADVGVVESAPRTTPSSTIDAVDRSYRASMPVPRISSSSGGGGSGGGGGSMGNAGAGS
ncbi:MAG TPA: hypothetical protein VHV77_16390 [Pirellulales bacterium]|jgi:hypothetical protein|nr:hypothetical protein [Pirellulales bacterium]